VIRLAAVYAHPDDDTYSVGGVLAKEGPGRIDYSLIVATSGEAGVISDPSLATRDNLGEVREAEERTAVSAVGFVDASIHYLRFPDGGVKEVPATELVGRIALLLEEIQPHIVVTFGPEGVTMHDDHVTVSRAATEAFHAARATVGEGTAFLRLYYNAIPQSSMDTFWEALRARGVDIGDPEGPYMPRGVPDETLAVRVDCRDVVKRKLDALLAHRTQRVELEYYPQDLLPEFLGEESFVQAWPPPGDVAGQAVRGSLLEDLDG
jgi:LmbE family N-acetylglucosaminyl deacetylase